MALKRSVEDFQLPQPIAELRVLGVSARFSDRCIEAPEDLLECIVVAFAVAAGKIGVAARRRLEQRWILNEYLIAGIAMAGPEFVGTLLVPCNGRSCPADLNAEAVLASGGDLASSDAAARAPAHAEEHGTEVLCI